MTHPADPEPCGHPFTGFGFRFADEPTPVEGDGSAEAPYQVIDEWSDADTTLAEIAALPTTNAPHR